MSEQHLDEIERLREQIRVAEADIKSIETDEVTLMTRKIDSVGDEFDHTSIRWNITDHELQGVLRDAAKSQKQSQIVKAQTRINALIRLLADGLDEKDAAQSPAKALRFMMAPAAEPEPDALALAAASAAQDQPIHTN